MPRAPEPPPDVALVALFVGLALVPFVLGILFGSITGIGFFLTVIAQLTLAVGSVIVLIYAIARGIQLSGVQG